jgi:ferredoxin
MKRGTRHPDGLARGTRRMAGVRIVLDSERCTGHGRCYSLAPELFDCDDRGYGTVIDPDVPAGLEEQARTAALNCPENAISLEE